MTPCAWTTSGASTSSGIATGRALGPSMALHVRAHRLRDSSVRRPTADGALSAERDERRYRSQPKQTAPKVGRRPSGVSRVRLRAGRRRGGIRL
jgi:hypothetical protein